MNNVGGTEAVLILLFSIPLLVLFVGVAPYVTSRRGGSRSRVVVAFLLSLIPYIGLIAGMIVALTTRRAGGFTSGATGTEQAALSATAPARPWGVGARIGLIALVLVLALAPIVAGIVGYYVGQQNVRTAPPVWTDREIRATGTQSVGTLRCTYHMADGTVRVRESVIALATDPPNNYFGTPNPLGARTPDCPPSP